MTSEIKTKFIFLKKTELLFAAALVIQIFFARFFIINRAPITIIDKPFAYTTYDFLSLGDKEFIFRVLGLKLQNAGDNWGKFTPLGEYDYGILIKWFDTLDFLSQRSNFAPFIAAYNYGLTNNSQDAEKIFYYLIRHAELNPNKKWRWLAHATYIARHRIKNLMLALEAAGRLTNLEGENIPIWARQLSAFIMTEVGEKEAARAILEAIMTTDKNISENEYSFMQQYINEKLK